RRKCICIFFFQAEDGIRDYKVTGVQTCALPILTGDKSLLTSYEDKIRPTVTFVDNRKSLIIGNKNFQHENTTIEAVQLVEGLRRSEERRVGKECSIEW